MFIIIALIFTFIITSIIVFGINYECEHTDEFHGFKRRRH